MRSIRYIVYPSLGKRQESGLHRRITAQCKKFFVFFKTPPRRLTSPQTGEAHMATNLRLACVHAHLKGSGDSGGGVQRTANNIGHARVKPVSFVFILILLFSSCTEFLSQDVSEVFLIINSPKDSLFIAQQTVTFWWEEQDQVEAYRLQLLEGDPANPFVLIDSLIQDNRLAVNLYEGRFFWKLRAENESSESAFQSRFFVIDTTSPFPATLQYPPDHASLNRDADLLELRFESRDQPISGISYPVKDSILLFKISDQTRSLVESFMVEENGLKQIPLAGIIEQYLEPDNTAFEWEIITTDQAGNVYANPSFHFSIYTP